VREADSTERAAIAAQLELLSCERFKVRYSLRPLDRGRAAFAGDLEADITQPCVVTLEPVESHLTGTFAVELWPVGELPASDDGVLDALADDVIEPIENGTIVAGRIVLERLGDLIDPYPRSPGATFSWTDEKAEAKGSDNPFAKLKNFGRGTQ
jgi:uncharacterized metal-binding protein YceD (DUF177 family)